MIIQILLFWFFFSNIKWLIEAFRRAALYLQPCCRIFQIDKADLWRPAPRLISLHVFTSYHRSLVLC